MKNYLALKVLDQLLYSQVTPFIEKNGPNNVSVQDKKPENKNSNNNNDPINGQTIENQQKQSTPLNKDTNNDPPILQVEVQPNPNNSKDEEKDIDKTNRNNVRLVS